MKFALVQGTRICQFVATKSDQFPVAPDLKWAQVADDVTDQDSYLDGKVVKQVPVPAVVPVQLSKAERVTAMLSREGLTPADFKAELAKL